jgi:hypothetical protein
MIFLGEKGYASLPLAEKHPHFSPRAYPAFGRETSPFFTKNYFKIIRRIK